jgi:acetylglutamate kinase
VAYLDKFAVTEEAQGEGLGRAVWNRFREDYPSIFWRARPNNAVNAFYFQNADGCVKGDEWNVFWCGLDDFDTIDRCVSSAMRARATLR